MSNSQSQDSQTDQAAEQRRRKRKERAAKSRTPEPKDIVSGAGQPLDIGVRRELEEQLGHDLSRVRLHTDRDAGVLTDLLGADAVAVGQDIFFRAGAYRPGTVDGQRLLAHELLHTVQNPDGLGALRVGRDLGAVSLPQQAIEREAESAAQDLVRPSVGEPAEATVDVSEGQATPGWMRYATVDADRNRIEQIDPATLVDRLTNSVVRSLRGDPEDRSKRTRMQLARLPEELLDGVLEHLESRLLSSEHERVLDLVDEIEQVGADGVEQNSLDVPVVERDPAEELRFEREAERQSAEEERDEEERDEERKPAGKPGPEKDTAGAEGADSGRGGGSSESTGRQSSAPAAPAAAPQRQASGQSASSGGKSDGGQQGGEKKAAGSEGAKEGQDQHGAPAATKEESAAKNRPGAVDALVAGRQLKQEDKLGADKPTGSPTASGKDTQLPGAVSTLDGVRNQDLDGLEEETGEDLSDSGSESEVEVGGAEKSAWDTKLQPEDFLPGEDLDVSAVPTADESDPGSAAAAVPSFPAPPATKADKVQAERDAEDAAAESESEEEVADAAGDMETAAAADEGGPEGGQSGGLDPEPAAAALPVPGTVSKDPKSGDDPKAGPVAAQTTVQEAPGKAAVGGDTQETAAKEASAKEEKGTPAAGDKSGVRRRRPHHRRPEARRRRRNPRAGSLRGRRRVRPRPARASLPPNRRHLRPRGTAMSPAAPLPVRRVAGAVLRRRPRRRRRPRPPLLKPWRRPRHKPLRRPPLRRHPRPGRRAASRLPHDKRRRHRRHPAVGAVAEVAAARRPRRAWERRIPQPPRTSPRCLRKRACPPPRNSSPTRHFRRCPA